MVPDGVVSRISLPGDRTAISFNVHKQGFLNVGVIERNGHMDVALSGNVSTATTKRCLGSVECCPLVSCAITLFFSRAQWQVIAWALQRSYADGMTAGTKTIMSVQRNHHSTYKKHPKDP